MLNEREMNMARELASELSSELSEVEHLNEKPIRTVHELLNRIGKAVIDTFDRIKEAVNTFVKSYKKQEVQRKRNWHLPMKLTMQSQVLNRKPLFVHNKNTI